MKNQILGIFIGLLVFVGLSNDAQAYPMFAKQTGADCTMCHIQKVRLNSTGRQFAVSGMTMSMKNFDSNSSDMDINPAVMLKSIYDESWNAPNKEGEVSITKPMPKDGGRWSVPTTASLLVGGRVSGNIGAIINTSYKDREDNSIQGKVIYAKEIQDGYMGAVAYSTAHFGAFSGMENYNTGLNKPIRTFDLRKLSNAFQACEIGTGEAMGVQVYFDRDNIFGGKGHLFATVGMFTPGQDNTGMDMSNNVLQLARMAYEYPVGDYNFILGGFGITGGSKVSSTEALSIDQESYGIDFQLEGELFEKSVSLVMSKVLKNKVTYTGVSSNLTNPEEFTNLDNKAFSTEAAINLIPSFGVKAAYMSFDDRSDYTGPNKGSGYEAGHIDVRDLKHAYTVGADYSFDVMFTSMKLAVEYSWAKPDLERVKDYEEFLVSLNILF